MRGGLALGFVIRRHKLMCVGRQRVEVVEIHHEVWALPGRSLDDVPFGTDRRVSACPVRAVRASGSRASGPDP